MVININKNKSYNCSNCGLPGHNYNRCREPTTSWGIILVKVNDKFDDLCDNESVDVKQFELSDGIQMNSANDIKSACIYMNSIQFLLIRRKHSLGYTEFIRGRYVKDNIDGIIRLFQQMTPEEIDKLDTMSFDDIWTDFWSGDIKKQLLNKSEFAESKKKFEDLRNKIGVKLALDFYIKNVAPFYTTPEWGFPKGRKSRGESDIDCATREFCEETGYNLSDIKLLSNVKPIIENMIGTNGVSYRHIYYLAEDVSNTNPKIEGNTEVGDIGFFSFEDAMKMFREYHVAKKNITKNIFMYYLNTMLNNKTKAATPEKKWSIDTDEF